MEEGPVTTALSCIVDQGGVRTCISERPLQSTGDDVAGVQPRSAKSGAWHSNRALFGEFLGGVDPAAMTAQTGRPNSFDAKPRDSWPFHPFVLFVLPYAPSWRPPPTNERVHYKS